MKMFDYQAFLRSRVKWPVFKNRGQEPPTFNLNVNDVIRHFIKDYDSAYANVSVSAGYLDDVGTTK